MKDYKIGDLVEVKGINSVKCSPGMLSPMPIGSVGLVTEVKDNTSYGIGYIVRFSERETFLYYHDELVEP